MQVLGENILTPRLKHKERVTHKALIRFLIMPKYKLQTLFNFFSSSYLLLLRAVQQPLIASTFRKHNLFQLKKS